MKLSDNLPIWAKEKRAPTRAELAAKHVADGGSMAYGVPESATDPTQAAFFEVAAAETELVPVGDTGTFIRQVKEAPTSKINVRRFNS